MANSAASDVFYKSISELSDLYKRKQTTPSEVTELFLQRIFEYDDQYLSYATVLHDDAVQRAELLTEELNKGKVRGPLHGIPIGIKDLCDMSGVKTMGGTAVLEDNVAQVDSTVVEKLQESGAVILGK